MKFRSLEMFSKKNNGESLNNSIEKSGDLELAPNKEIYGLLSDPEFIKTFPGPADFQYQILRENLVSSKQDAINSMAYLKDFIKKSNNSLFSLIRFSQFLHTAIGNQKNFSHDKEQKEISNILEKGFNEISSDKDVKYFLSIMLKPSIVFSPTQSFENQERGLTPVQISKEYFVQDNGFDPIPIFYHTEKPKEFISIIEKQKRFFENARPESRPEITKNPSLEEMKEYKDKYLKETINFKENKKEIKEKMNNVTTILKPEEIQKFFPSSHNIFELTQDPLMFEFRAFVNPEVRFLIEKEFAVDFREIPLKEQIYFLTSISNRTNETIKPVQEFTKKFKAIGLRTFLSIEQGGESMGNKILALGNSEKLPEEVASKVFAKYGEIIDSVDEITTVLKERFGKEEDNQELIISIRENLFKKGKDLLVESSDAISNNKEENVLIGEELSKKLNNMKKSAILLGSVFKTVLKEGMKLDQIKDVSIESINNENEIFRYKDELLRIFKENRINYPPELMKETLAEFEQALNDINNKEFYILKDKEDIIAFMRFDKLSDGNLYAGSLNTRSEIKGLALGGELLKKLLIEKSKDNNIEAVVFEKNPMVLKYTNGYGFKIVGEINNYKNTGQKFYKLEIKKGSI